MLNNFHQNNEQVIREEDLEKSKSDIYNSSMPEKNNFFKKDFSRFFRLPLIILVSLIALLFILKFLFFHKTKSMKIKNTPEKNTAVSYKKRFSPSVFNYASKAGTPDADKFKIKFKKETEKLNGKIKFKRERRTRKNVTEPMISKKMVVFIMPGYAKNILKEEKGFGPSVQNKKLAHGTQAGDKNLCNRTSIAVKEGTVLNAYTEYKIFSYNTSVPVIAVLTGRYVYRGKTILKKGDKFFGTVSVKHSLNRLNISFNKIIGISGKGIGIDAIAMMPDGSGGVKGEIHRHYAGNILASIAQGVVGAASIVVGGGSAINSSNPYTFQNQARENIAQNELNSARNGLSGYSSSNQNASITLPAETPIKIIFLKPLYYNRIK